MKLRQRFRRLYTLGGAAIFIIALISNLFVFALPAKTAEAENPRTLPDPVAPSETCEWYGEMGWQRETHVDNEVYDHHQTTTDVMNVSSAPVDGEECGLRWAARSQLDYIDRDVDYCGFDVTKVRTYTDKRDYVGSGNGHYTATISALGGGQFYPSLFAYAHQTFYGTEKSSVVGGCTNDDLHNEVIKEKGPLSINPGCWGGFDQDQFFVDPNAQAMVGTCKYETSLTNESGTVQTSLESYSWRLRRTSCNPTIDTDRGGVNDCLEYEARTNPHNPLDDVPPPAECPTEANVAAQWTPWTNTLTLSATAVPAASYNWSFGDGTAQTTAEPAVRHDYAKDGPVDPVVTISSAECPILSATTHIIVDPINYYAPSVYFDSKEDFFAGDPMDFVNNSVLRWSQEISPECEQTIAKGVALGPKPQKALDPARLGTGSSNPYATSCEPGVPPVNEYNSGTPILKTNEFGGYFLDLRTPEVKKGNTTSPLYAEMVADDVIIYWLWYPHNKWKDAGITEIHEGDWEHVVLRLKDKTLEADEVAFYQHYCTAKTYPFASLEKDGFAGSIMPGEHFVVYAARGGHASYPHATNGREFSCLPTPSYDIANGQGSRWRPWFQGEIRDASEQAWYGFAGAWGNRSDGSTPIDEIDNYGPQGPGPVRSFQKDSDQQGHAVPNGWL